MPHVAPRMLQLAPSHGFIKQLTPPVPAKGVPSGHLFPYFRNQGGEGGQGAREGERACEREERARERHRVVQTESGLWARHGAVINQGRFACKSPDWVR